ncbi:hypothetical protein HYQ44_004027 [Verticillium longisporum]|nr:hypothetical protein HYQ44_004027 [Verticillium longisporum]
MAENDSTSQARAKARRGLLPPELIDVVVPSIKVGGLTGAAGVFTGITAGIIRDASPALFGIASGIQWFTLGSTFWLSRTVAIKALGGEAVIDKTDRTKASALAGGTAGAVGGLIRGPRNILPGFIIFSLAGGIGQLFTNGVVNAPANPNSKSILQSKWSPLKKLTDDEYRHLMDEKLLRIDTEIALIDDKIAELRASHQEAGNEPLPPPVDDASPKAA